MYRARYGEHGDQGVPQGGQRELSEVQSGCLSKIGNCLFDGFALRCGARLGIQGDEATFFRVGEDSSQFHGAPSVSLARWDYRSGHFLTPNYNFTTGGEFPLQLNRRAHALRTRALAHIVGELTDKRGRLLRGTATMDGELRIEMSPLPALP